MHYYKKNLGDYAKKTGRLSILQHGAYTLLLDACYDREQFPTLAQAMDWLLPINDEETAAITFILNRFFTLEGDVYVQPRIKEELEAYQSKALKNKQIAVDREKAKKTKRTRNVHETYQEREPNQEPRTINQEPLTKKTKEKKAAPPDAVVEKVTPSGFMCFWNAYPKGNRKSKKATLTKWNASKLDMHREAIIANIEKRKLEDDRWKGGYIPDALVFLNQERWTGDIYRQAPRSGDKVQRNGFEQTEYSEEF